MNSILSNELANVTGKKVSKKEGHVRHRGILYTESVKHVVFEMNIKNAIEKIAYLPSISGHEYMIHDEIISICESIFDEVTPKKNGSIIAVKRCGMENAPRLLLDAHIDEVGMYVTEILDGGFLRTINVGGVDTRILYASQVTIYGKEIIKGVFASTPPHLNNDKSDALDKINKMIIDTGIPKEKLEKIVEIGTPVGFSGGVDFLQNKLVSSKGMDDRICIIAIIKAVSMVKKMQKYDVYALFSSQEETSSLGAVTSVLNINPDIALVVDVGHAKMKGIEKIGALELVGGTAVSFSATTSRKLTNAICDTAKRHRLPLQKVSESSNTGTNAHKIQTSLEGIPTAVLSIPLRNMHTPCEIVSLDDVENTARLIAEFIEDGLFLSEEAIIVG